MSRFGVSAVAAALLSMALACGGGASGAESVVKEIMAALKADDFKKAGGYLGKEIQAGRVVAKDEATRGRAAKELSDRKVDDMYDRETIRGIRALVAEQKIDVERLKDVYGVTTPPDQIKKMSDDELMRVLREIRERKKRPELKVAPGIDSVADLMMFGQLSKGVGIITGSKADGDSAQVDVDTPSGNKYRWSLNREDGEWKIRSVAPLK